MNYVALKNEIENDPLSLGYAAHVTSGSDAGVANLLNKKDFRGPVPIVELSAYCVITGLIGACEVASGDPAVPPQIRGVCITVTTLLRDDFRLTTCDVDDPAFGLSCDALVAAGIMSSAQKTAMLAMGEARRSRCDVLFPAAPGVTQSDVSFALRNQR